MGRDWTPLDCIIADEHTYITRGAYLHEAKLDYSKSSGVNMQLWNDKARADFPNLSYLLNGFELNTYQKLSSDFVSMGVYREIETELEEMSQAIRKQVRDKASSVDLSAFPDSTVKKWFMGELDPMFYYSETNNQMFEDYIDGQISERKSKLKDIPTAKPKMKAHEQSDITDSPTMTYGLSLV